MIPAILFLIASSLAAAERGLLWGRVRTLDAKPCSSAKVTVTFADGGPAIESTTDASGYFRLSGFPPGRFIVRVEAADLKTYENRDGSADPAASIELEVVLVPASDKARASGGAFRSLASNFSQTVLSRRGQERLPSGNNLWNLVENQDLSATSNRIDVGGLWTGVPARFSGRGSASWTQSAFLLNGMDFTDPYQGGTPLFYPDFFTWDYTRLVNADLPVQALAPGAYDDILTLPESPRWHGGFSAFYADKAFSTSNITPALEAEHLTDEDKLGRLADFHFHVTGPISNSVSFLASLTSQSLTRHIAQFAPDDASTVLSGTLGVRFALSDGSTLRLLWTGQDVKDSEQGAARLVDPAATLKGDDTYNVAQAIWEKRFSPGHLFRAGLGLASGRLSSDFQADAQAPNRSDIFLGQDQGAAAEADHDSRLVVNAFADGQAFLGGSASVHHLLEYGANFRYASASSDKTILDGLRLITDNGQPLEVEKFNTPTTDKEAAFRLNAYGQETIFFGHLVSLTAGLTLGYMHGWVPGTAPTPQAGWSALTPASGGTIDWFTLSPRLSADLPLSETRNSYIRVSAARRYFSLPLSYLAYGNPGSLGGLVYSWSDTNGDGRFEDNETGALLHRDGPLFGQVDPSLKPPSIDELVVALNLDFGRRWVFSIAGYLRETRNLVAAQNTGVPDSDYDPVTLQDAGDDAIPGSYDDLTFTVFNQKAGSLGQDFYLLTNVDADTRVSRYRGVDVTVVKAPGGAFDFFFSFQAIEAIGWANPGNSELENDDGVVGDLYANPNTLINAKGRLRFDRGFTARLGFSFETIAGIRLGAIVKYYDGQPFARQIIVDGFNQGPFFIMAHPRGVARYEYNRTVDVRVEKAFAVGPTRLRLILDGFNIFNNRLATEQSPWSGPDFGLRFATEIESPRMFRLGVALDF